MYNILVTGDRFWIEYSVVYEALAKAWDDFVKTSPAKSTRNITVVHGAAKGADTHAGFAAHKLGMGVRTYPANWNKYKKGAGPIRNSLMLKENKIDIVLAFHDHIKESKGTLDMVKKALELRIPVRLHQSDGSHLMFWELPVFLDFIK